jgi:hypothetical protein
VRAQLRLPEHAVRHRRPRWPVPEAPTQPSGLSIILTTTPKSSLDPD